MKQKLTKAQVDEMLETFLNDCTNQEGATMEDKQFVKDRNFPTNHEQRCIVACVGESFAIVSCL